MRYGDAPELVREVIEAKERWAKQRFYGIYTQQEAIALGARAQERQP